jgi:DNA polymerase III subunit gamma/tau
VNAPSDSGAPNLFGEAPAKGGYLVLARKYRPRTFADLIGQEAMVRTIANSFALGRVPHAYMLTGVRGVGKTTTARLIARALNYKRGDIDKPSIELDPPGEHCQAIMESRHPDVFELDAATRTKVEQTRELLEGIPYAPVMARYKVYILDEVHMLSDNSWNALLKTLEEPPPHVKFVFATTEIRKVPVTVLSRCQRFDLKRVDSERLAQHLANIAAKENVKVEPDGLMLVARAAEGSVRDALSLMDQAIVQKSGEAVSAADIRTMIGLSDRARVLDLMEAVARADAKTALAEARSQYDSGADPQLILRDLMEIIHDAARAQAMGADARLIGGADWTARVRKLGDTLSPAQLSRLWQMLLKALEEANGAPDPIAAVEMAMVRLCAAQGLPPPEEAARLLRDGAGAAGAAPASTAPAGESADGPAPKLRSFDDVVALAEARRDIKLELLLGRLRIVSFRQGDIVYAPLDDAPADLPRRIISLIAEDVGEDWRVRAEHPGPAAAVESLAERRKRERERALDVIRAHPFVAEALKHFPGAEIVKVTEPADDEAGAGADVVQMPSPRRAEETPRKKEADR